VSAGNIPGQDLYQFIVNDFESAWEAMEAQGSPGGNFLFARQAMALLELACRACYSNKTALRDLSRELHLLEPRYFTVLPATFPGDDHRRGFRLPSWRAYPNRQLLWALFDLIRNGQAHQYQQMLVRLQDGKIFGITLTGVERGRPLASARSASRVQRHLGYRTYPNGDLWMVVLPELLYLDLKDAITASRVFSRRPVQFRHWMRPSPRSHHYRLTATEFQRRLRDARHPQI
jgi:hypothetical protein